MIFEKIRETFRNIHRVVECDEDLEWNRAVYKCTTIVDEVEAEYNNGWIPCEVELPKIATSYLVAEEVIVNSKKLYVVDIRLFGTEDEWLCPSNRKIIAWQPLPQPPKGE